MNYKVLTTAMASSANNTLPKNNGNPRRLPTACFPSPKFKGSRKI